jgi:hypothetical protein
MQDAVRQQIRELLKVHNAVLLAHMEQANRNVNIVLLDAYQDIA